MDRERQIAFLSKADDRQQARWAKKMNDPKFVENLRRYDGEIAVAKLAIA